MRPFSTNILSGVLCAYVRSSSITYCVRHTLFARAKRTDTRARTRYSCDRRDTNSIRLITEPVQTHPSSRSHRVATRILTVTGRATNPNAIRSSIVVPFANNTFSARFRSTRVSYTPDDRPKTLRAPVFQQATTTNIHTRAVVLRRHANGRANGNIGIAGINCRHRFAVAYDG